MVSTAYSIYCTRLAYECRMDAETSQVCVPRQWKLWRLLAGPIKLVALHPATVITAIFYTVKGGACLTEANLFRRTCWRGCSSWRRSVTVAVCQFRLCLHNRLTADQCALETQHLVNVESHNFPNGFNRPYIMQHVTFCDEFGVWKCQCHKGNKWWHRNN